MNNFKSAFCRIDLRIYQYAAFGKARRRIFLPARTVGLLIASVILLITYLDRSRQCLIKVCQQSMAVLQRNLKKVALEISSSVVILEFSKT